VEDYKKIKCKCGRFQALLRNSEKGVRAICYCKDCQIYAHYLKASENILNRLRGTEVIAVRPQQFAILCGREVLGCCSLTPLGSLRWFSQCCSTPICNMSRNIRTAHISIIHTCMEKELIEKAFGNRVIHAKRHGAIGTPPKNEILHLLNFGLNYLASVTCTYVTRGYRRNPLINWTTSKPIVNPLILTSEELRKITEIVQEKSR